MIKYYDIGLNLFCRQFPDPEKIIADAADEGVFCILTGTDPRENVMVDRFSRSHDVYGTAGIHPHSADEVEEKDFEQIEQIVTENPRIVAVGECGLDFDRMYSTRENQIACFERQIELAERTGKPLFLHERSAAKEFTRMFLHHPHVCSRSVVHCFTGDRKTLERYLEMGFFIGITGWICDERRADELRDAVSVLPLDRVMLETDAPYLTPRGIKGLGRTNVPGNIRYVARELAKYMGVAQEELIACAKVNTEQLFSLERR